MSDVKGRIANDPLATSWAARLRSALRAHARAHLPEAMVPARFVVLPELPKLPNGKVDRAALPAPVARENTQAAYVAPRTAVERQLARIWQDLLGVDEVGAETSFFDLGGDSLTALQMAAQVRDVYGVRLDLRRVFENPTVAQVARMVDKEADPAVTGVSNPRGVSREEMTIDAVLPDDVVPEADALEPATAPYRRVLLTGGTGYTGAFLLRELLDRSTATVYVLARAADDERAAERVWANLTEYGLLRDGDQGRVVGVAGDTGRPWFGLRKATYGHLAGEVEMIIHNAAVSSWIAPYPRLKPVNVFGALEVLRLACRSRVKPVHFVSTTGVYPAPPGEPRWAEEPLRAPDGVVGGYRQSKWVADSLMLAARERGVPTHVYRPGAITGSQVTGACATDTFINHLIKGCIQLGAYLDYDLTLELVPVDYCAAAVAHIALGDARSQAVYNLPGARPVRMNEVFELIAGFGYPLRRLDYRDWYRELTGAIERGEDNEMRRYLPLFGKDQPAEEIGVLDSRPAFDDSHLRAALRGSGVACSPVDRALMDLYLKSFISIGYLPAPVGGDLSRNKWSPLP